MSNAELTLAGKTDAEIYEIANSMMDNLMDASTRIDHAGHVRDFSERLKAIVTPEYFDRICRNYQQEKGFFKEREPLAIFRRPSAVGVVWKQSYTKMEGEFVAEMLLVERDGRYVVDHVMVW